MLKIDYINLNEAIIIINKNDYDKVIDNKTIYEIEIVSYLGFINTKRIINTYKYILIFIIGSFMIIYLLSNFIFKVEVITNDKIMKKRIINYLSSKGVSKYHLKKNYNELKRVKEGLLTKYKNSIDWVEIEVVGSKYIVRFEPRLKTNLKKDAKYQNIIASKNAIIYSMDITKGQIIKNRFDYVKKGDVIVSGYIFLNDKIMNTEKSEGVVYGETWYKIKVKYPYNFKSIKETGNKKKVLKVNIINQDINLFSNYKEYKKSSKVLLKNNILPIKISLDNQIELNIEKENNSTKQAIKKAVIKAKNKIREKLDDNEYIKDYKILNTINDKDNVTVDIFFSVVEKISKYEEIEEYKNTDNES